MSKFYKTAVLLFVLAIGFSSCEKDHDSQERSFIVAFSKHFLSFSKIKDEANVTLVFSKKAEFDGMVTIKVSQKNAAYGIDFNTIPAVSTSNEFKIPIKAGQMSTDFVFKNLIYPFDREDKYIEFEIVSVDYAETVVLQGFTRMVISFDASLGDILEPAIGGPNQAYQVYVELSNANMVVVSRNSWDLAFSSEQNRVKINGSVYMAVKKLNFYDIDQVSESQVSGFFPQVAVGTFDPTNENYIDAPSGDITKTAIAEIKENDGDNAVYLLNLGFDPGKIANPAGADVTGDHRGWRKIRILNRGDNYLLQYASLDESTHKEVLIAKKQAYSFSFYSLLQNKEVLVEPEKGKWDLNFTVFTNIISGSGSYGYSDFVSLNTLGKVRAYAVIVEGNEKEIVKKVDEAYSNAIVDPSKFSNDQRVIGAEWRDVFSGQAFKDRFFVLEDAKGNYYKIRMMSMLNEGGKRGYPKFEYELIP